MPNIYLDFMSIDSNLFKFGLFPGMLGGVMLHAYWLLWLGYSGKVIPVVAIKSGVWSRHLLMLLSAVVGGSAGFLVFTWFYVEMQTGIMPVQKVMVLAALAGLSGDSFVRVSLGLSDFYFLRRG